MTLSSTSIDAVFDDLKRRLDALGQDPRYDNEATRHDRLVVPFLTHPLLLGWDLNDLVGQASIAVPNQLLDSHIFRGAQPKSRKPDILVTSTAFNFNALVVEEKDGQPSIDDLNGYRFQLHEYQSLYECVWGLLTDGERWILKKGLESFHTFDSLDDLQAGLPDIQYCIGKRSLLARKLAHGTCDLVIVVPSVTLANVVNPAKEPQQPAKPPVFDDPMLARYVDELQHQIKAVRELPSDYLTDDSRAHDLSHLTRSIRFQLADPGNVMPSDVGAIAELFREAAGLFPEDGHHPHKENILQRAAALEETAANNQDKQFVL